MKDNTETAIFAMGCFWGPQELFDNLPGVISTVVGYSGGEEEYTFPSYEQVCSGETNHAESIKIEYDPMIISYYELLDVFFQNHDPTTKNRQGPDIGNQYRSIIFYMDLEQKKLALKSLKKYQEKSRKPIVSEVLKFKIFYPAEDYHQKYYKKHEVSCNINLNLYPR